MKKLLEMYRMPAYETWAPVLGRVLLGVLFLIGASGKIPGSESFDMVVTWTAAAGVPLAYFAVLLAFIIELLGGIMLIVGYKTRKAGFVLAIFTLIITPIFHWPWMNGVADQAQMMMFFKNLAIVGGLLYASVYGAQHAAMKKCPLPHSVHGAH